MNCNHWPGQTRCEVCGMDKTIVASKYNAIEERALQIIADEERFAASDPGDIYLHALRVTRIGTAKQILGIIQTKNQMRDVRMWKALRSIASSTCCEGCQEAAKVARAALNEEAESNAGGGYVSAPACRQALLFIQEKIANRSFINTWEIRSTIENALIENSVGATDE